MVALENSLGLDEMRNPSAAAFDGSVPSFTMSVSPFATFVKNAMAFLYRVR